MDYSNIHIETTLPKPWEQELSFNDLLYNWMNRAPWLAISAAAHLLAFFILMAVPWDKLTGKKDKVIEASIAPAQEEVFEEIEEPEPEEEPIEEPLEEPVLKEAEISDHNEEETMEYDSMEGDPDFLNDSPFDQDQFNNVLGIGGGAGGKFGGRFGGRKNLRAAGGSGTEQALRDGLEWLKAHQSEDGSWDCDDFMQNCGKIGQTVCDGPGQAPHDVGLTGLALLAFLGDGNTTSQGQYKDVVARGIAWLNKQADRDTGLIGDNATHNFIYNHAIATLAVCEAYYFSKSPTLKGTAQRAINYIQRARNPYGAWRYEVPPIGDNDTSVTGWMVFALASARDAKLEIDPEALDGARSWIDEATDPATGRVGYNTRGSLSSRTPANERFPREHGEAMTAVGLLSRFFLGQDPEKEEIMEAHAKLLLRTPPVWDPEGLRSDFYYWYYGTYAMFQMGGDKYWTPWNKAMKPAVLESQRQDGDEKGSWDPIDPWSYAGGRVYATALNTLCLEVYFRYTQIVGSR